MPELRRREATLRAELDALDTDLHNAETYLKLTETLDAFRARLSANAENLTVQQRQQIVRLVVREVLLGDDDITVRHSIPSRRTDSQRVRYCIRNVKARVDPPIGSSLTTCDLASHATDRNPGRSWC